MNAERVHDAEEDDLVLSVGRDEMNLVEIPLGPITRSPEKTLRVSSSVFDAKLKRHVTRQTVVTGSDAFGLPRPIDEKVLVGMITLTHEAGFKSREVQFSGYRLCKTIGWNPDGRAYRRLEDSLDRIGGTTLKFKDAWFDNGEKEWKSKTFHIIEEASLCSRAQLERGRKSASSEVPLCRFVWSETVWKSFGDGFIRRIDMNLFRRISSGRRREIPLRLFRILDKRFYRGRDVKFDLRTLCMQKLGMSDRYCRSEMLRILRRAVGYLFECGYQVSLEMQCGERCVFKLGKKRADAVSSTGSEKSGSGNQSDDSHSTNLWVASHSEEQLQSIERHALETGFGSELERRLISEARHVPIMSSGAIRKAYLKRFAEQVLCP